jgi:hypothetical protein
LEQLAQIETSPEAFAIYKNHGGPSWRHRRTSLACN